ncbi:MAG TPA: DNA-binding protein [Acetobacteraceae bacterium]|jgi:predicted nucleic acid-binding protein|nr:DNA-binding protein [Acetobacteraceae bacterium]
MGCSSFLADNLGPLALDTSVLINLHACTHGERILAAIPNEIVIPEIVAGELENETSRRNGEQEFLQKLLASGTVTLSGLTDEAWEIFQELTSSSFSLDDGEAATIATAATRHFFPVIDERRGRARASAFVKVGIPFWSLDILLHPQVTAELGAQATIEALYRALRNGRMRIPPASVDQVIALIGMERSIDCTCLPGYGERFGRRGSLKTVC